MKCRFHLHDNISGKDIVGSIEITAKDHLAAQQKYKATIVRARKGKGSFTRKIKHKKKVEDS